jgi:hypothetical protein
MQLTGGVLRLIDSRGQDFLPRTLITQIDRH